MTSSDLILSLSLLLFNIRFTSDFNCSVKKQKERKERANEIKVIFCETLPSLMLVVEINLR